MSINTAKVNETRLICALICFLHSQNIFCVYVFTFSLQSQVLCLIERFNISNNKLHLLKNVHSRILRNFCRGESSVTQSLGHSLTHTLAVLNVLLSYEP